MASLYPFCTRQRMPRRLFKQRNSLQRAVVGLARIFPFSFPFPLILKISWSDKFVSAPRSCYIDQKDLSKMRNPDSERCRPFPMEKFGGQTATEVIICPSFSFCPSRKTCFGNQNRLLPLRAVSSSGPYGRRKADSKLFIVPTAGKRFFGDRCADRN